MNILINSAELQYAIGKMLSVVEKGTPRPILSYAILEASKDGPSLRVSATDMEVAARVVVRKVQVLEGGGGCVNPKNLFDILREIPAGDIRIEMMGNILKIQKENMSYSFLTYETEDFPHLSFHHEPKSFSIRGENLQKIISKVSHAISLEEGRIHLGGIYLSEYEGKLRSVSTDGNRLAMLDLDLENFGPGSIAKEGIIVPRKGVFELKKMTEDHDNSNIKISSEKNVLYASAGNEYFVSVRLITRDYPRYHKVIPSDLPFNAFIDRDIFLNSVRRMRIMSNEKFNGVILKIDNHQIELSANDPSRGDAFEVVPIERKGKAMENGEFVEIGLNARYLIDSLTTIDDGDVSIKFSNDKVPFCLKSVQNEDYLSIIMPIEF